MWIQSPSIASFTRQNFQSNIDSKICQGPSMDSTLGTVSRHHDKILQCCYFNAKMLSKELEKGSRRCQHKENKSKSSELYSMFAIFTMSCFKSIVMISKSEDFYAPLLLERWIQTEASGGICSGVLRVSPICTDCLQFCFCTLCIVCKNNRAQKQNKKHPYL